MDKLRILPMAFVCGTIFTPPAFAQLTTIGPGTPGVTESMMTLEQTSVVNGVPFSTPVFTPVPLGSGGGGTSSLWDMSMGCLQGCFGTAASNGPFDMFAVSFSKPVSFVSALQQSGVDADIWIYAYNSADQLVGSCGAAVTGLPGNMGCFTFVSSGPPGVFPPAFVNGNYTVSNDNANISTVLLGGYGTDVSGTLSVAFSVTPIKSAPEPGTFALFAFALAGLAVARKRLA